MRTKIPQLKVTAVKKEEKDKKGGLAGTLSGVGRMVSGAGASGANAAGGLMGTLSGGLNGLIATKAGLMGLIAIGTAGALGLGVLASKSRAPNPKDAAPIDGNFFAQNGGGSVDQPAPKQMLETSRADSTALMAEATKGEQLSFSGDQPKPAEPAKTDDAVKPAEAKAAAAQAPARSGGSGLASADPFAGKRMSGGVGLSGGVGQSFSSMGGVTPGGGGAPAQTASLQQMNAGGKVESLTKANDARTHMVASRNAAMSNARRQLGIANNQSQKAASASNPEAASYAAAGAFDANGSAASPIGGGGLSAPAGSGTGDTEAGATPGAGNKYTPPTPAAKATNDPLADAMKELMMCMTLGMAAAGLAAMIAQQMSGSGSAWNTVGMIAVIALAGTALVCVGKMLAILFANKIGDKGGGLNGQDGQGLMVALYTVLSLAIATTAISAFFGAKGKVQTKEDGLKQVDDAAKPAKGKEGEAQAEMEKAKDGAAKDGAAKDVAAKDAAAKGSEGGSSDGVAGKDAPSGDAAKAAKTDAQGASQPSGNQKTMTPDQVQQKVGSIKNADPTGQGTRLEDGTRVKWDPNTKTAQEWRVDPNDPSKGQWKYMREDGTVTTRDYTVKDGKFIKTDGIEVTTYKDGHAVVSADKAGGAFGAKEPVATIAKNGAVTHQTNDTNLINKAQNTINTVKGEIAVKPPSPAPGLQSAENLKTPELGSSFKAAGAKGPNLGVDTHLKNNDSGLIEASSSETGGGHGTPQPTNAGRTIGGQQAAADHPTTGQQGDVPKAKGVEPQQAAANKDAGAGTQAQDAAAKGAGKGAQAQAAPAKSSGGGAAKESGNALSALSDSAKGLTGLAQNGAGGGAHGADAAHTPPPGQVAPASAPTAPAAAPKVPKMGGAGGGHDIAQDGAPADAGSEAGGHDAAPAGRPTAKLPTAGGGDLVQSGGAGQQGSSLVQGSAPAQSYAAPQSVAPGGSGGGSGLFTDDAGLTWKQFPTPHGSVWRQVTGDGQLMPGGQLLPEGQAPKGMTSGVS